MKKGLSRRKFLNISAGAAAGSVLAACGAQPTPEKIVETVIVEKEGEKVVETVIVEKEVEVEKEVVVTATPEPEAPPPEEVVLEVRSQNPEYANAEQQIWDVYAQQNPGVQVKVFSVNEEEQPAHEAKIAGGWIPAMDQFRPPTKDNYQLFVNMLDVDFPWWDRYEYDAKNAFTTQWGIEDVAFAGRILVGRIFTWHYHVDLMEEAGLDPRNSVQTWDDLQNFLEAGTEWAASNPDVDHFFDLAWHAWGVGTNHVHMLSMAFPDGQREQQRQCYLGEMAFNDPASPYRHTFETLKTWHEKGIIPEKWWLRDWESEMEASYIAKKSVMLLHGPWVWDKMLAADPTAVQAGLPATPPAEGQDAWVNFMRDVAEPDAALLYQAAMDKPEWPVILDAYFWFFSPEAVRMRAEMQSQPTVYTLDESLDLTGGQWDGMLKEFYTPDGIYNTVEIEAEASGQLAAARFINEGAKGVFDENGALPTKLGELMQDEISVEGMLDWLQGNWEDSYSMG